MKFAIPLYSVATLRGYVSVEADCRESAVDLAIEKAQSTPDAVRVWDYGFPQEYSGHPNDDFELDTHPKYNKYDDAVYLNEAPGADATSTRELIAVIDSVDLTDSRVVKSLEKESAGNRYVQSYLYIKLIDLAYTR